MSTHTSNTKRGFTLIEVLIYLGLYSIIMGGAVTAIYTIFESSAHNQAQALVQEEGGYLIGKIDWALANARVVLQPASSGTTLSVTKYDGSNTTVSLAGTDMQIQEGVIPLQTINNSNVRITSLTFTHASASADGINPESISAVFTIGVTTSDGFVFSRDFSTMKYLRK